MYTQREPWGAASVGQVPWAQAGVAFKIAQSTEDLHPTAGVWGHNLLVAGSQKVRGFGGSGQSGGNFAGGQVREWVQGRCPLSLSMQVFS